MNWELSRDLQTRLDALAVEPKPPAQTNLPPVEHTPRPVRDRVISRPVRVPINRQTALLISPNRDWLTQPPPDRPGDALALKRTVSKLQAQLKAAYNFNGEVSARLGNALAAVKELRQQVTRGSSENEQQKKLISEQLAAIARLQSRIELNQIPEVHLLLKT